MSEIEPSASEVMSRVVERCDSVDSLQSGVYEGIPLTREMLVAAYFASPRFRAELTKHFRDARNAAIAESANTSVSRRC